MAYRNGTYIAFHAEGKANPTASDIRYYHMLKAWHKNDGFDFKFVNSHEKASVVRDTSAKATIMRSLRLRLDNSKNMVLIVGSTTKNEGFIPFTHASGCGLTSDYGGKRKLRVACEGRYPVAKGEEHGSSACRSLRCIH